ncbi:MAG: hypothetical protein P4L77_12040 [Sulfuriferula sp.]|nr:hypothetical protein [Sulfuriferula sp.]
MKKKLIVMFSTLLLGAAAYAQNTTVTATVVDSDTIVWANAPWTLAFVTGPSQSNPANYTIGGAPLSAAVTSQKGTANGSGVISFTVYQSTAIMPISSSWRLTVCPNASAACGVYNFSTSTSSVNISSGVNGVIQAPRFHATPGTYGYSSVEATLSLAPANQFFNTALNCIMVYSGTSWSCSGGGVSTGSVIITDPPYNAKCDGSTNDRDAIQTALNACPGTVAFPEGVGGVIQQCNINSTLNWPSGCSSLALDLRGGNLAYTPTSGHAIYFDGNAPGFPYIGNGSIELTSTTGTPDAIGGASNMVLDSMYFGGHTHGAQAINMAGTIDVYITGGMYSNIPSTLGAKLVADGIEMNCFDTTQTGWTIPASYVTVFNSLSIADCLYDIHADTTVPSPGQPRTQTLTINSGDFGYFYATPPASASAFDLPPTDGFSPLSINGNVQFKTSQMSMFSASSSFAGNVMACDPDTDLCTQYKTTPDFNPQPVTITAGPATDPANGGTAVCATGYICTPGYGTVLVTYGTTPADGDLFTVGWLVPKSTKAIISSVQAKSTIVTSVSGCYSYDVDNSTTTAAVVYSSSLSCGALVGNLELVPYTIQP